LRRSKPTARWSPKRCASSTTLAWKAVNLVEATDDEWQFVKHAIGIDRGWDAAYRLVSTLDLPGQEPPRQRNA
jgi:hypothetical protein